mmetsp:Transcript_13230/g.23711  ORF Transcript_13230/g.23711 Transcript_13230/m.23711 type:complete len:232 (+) Transcript_13230:2049-2744(+)
MRRGRRMRPIRNTLPNPPPCPKKPNQLTPSTKMSRRFQGSRRYAFWGRIKPNPTTLSTNSAVKIARNTISATNNDSSTVLSLIKWGASSVSAMELPMMATITVDSNQLCVAIRIIATRIGFVGGIKSIEYSRLPAGIQLFSAAAVSTTGEPSGLISTMPFFLKASFACLCLSALRMFSSFSFRRASLSSSDNVKLDMIITTIKLRTMYDEKIPKIRKKNGTVAETSVSNAL